MTESPERLIDPEEPAFREPWEAHAFAIAVRLHEQGLFTWPQWAAALADEVAADADTDAGGSYYEHWLGALERLVAETGAASAEALHETREAWRRAAHRTPHGAPIELEPDDFAR